MFKNLGLQLYSIRDYMKDPEMADFAFERVAKMGYTEAQTAGNAFEAELFGKLLTKHGIKIVGTHYDYGEIINNPEKTMEIHRMWGTTNVGIGGMPGEARGSLANLNEFIDKFNKVSEIYAKNGFKLTYHNHNFEFVRIDGFKTLMDVMYEKFNPDTISFVLDTCWVAAGGADVCAWIEKLAGRIDILHLKDITVVNENGRITPRMTEIGNGNLEWNRILKTAEETGVKHYVVEQDGFFLDGNNPFASLKASADYLKPFIK